MNGTKSRIRLAVADGHQRKYGSAFLLSCGIEIEGYETPDVARRPGSNLENTLVKVIRPQDMPTQVANGHFDVAVTGEDWFKDHRYQFPDTPVKKLMNLGFGGVRVCAVVHNDLGVKSVDQFKDLFSRGAFPFPYIRIASEYVNIADHFAYTHHFQRYKVIPTSGSTEAYLPEDADIIIENSQTGRTLKVHNLGVIKVLFESTACIIANTNSLKDKGKGRIIEGFVTRCRVGLQEDG